MMQIEVGKYVVVTTDKDKRGVFAGNLLKYDREEGVVILTEARMAVRWSAETRGVTGLAGIGPQSGSRISPPVPKAELVGVTAVMECSETAKEQWEKGIWD